MRKRGRALMTNWHQVLVGVKQPQAELGITSTVLLQPTTVFTRNPWLMRHRRSRSRKGISIITTFALEYSQWSSGRLPPARPRLHAAGNVRSDLAITLARAHTRRLGQPQATLHLGIVHANVVGLAARPLEAVDRGRLIL